MDGQTSQLQLDDEKRRSENPLVPLIEEADDDEEDQNRDSQEKSIEKDVMKEETD